MGRGDLILLQVVSSTCVGILFGLTMLQPLVRAAGDDLFIPKLFSVAFAPLYHLTLS